MLWYTVKYHDVFSTSSTLISVSGFHMHTFFSYLLVVAVFQFVLMKMLNLLCFDEALIHVCLCSANCLSPHPWLHWAHLNNWCILNDGGLWLISRSWAKGHRIEEPSIRVLRQSQKHGLAWKLRPHATSDKQSNISVFQSQFVAVWTAKWS